MMGMSDLQSLHSGPEEEKNRLAAVGGDRLGGCSEVLSNLQRGRGLAFEA